MADVTVANTSPGIAGKTLACHDADGVTTGLWTFANPIALKSGASGSQTWRLSVAPSGNLNVLADGSGLGLSLNTAGDLYEKGRATALGTWIDVSFNAANFSATAPMTWTVGPAAVVRNRYALIGNVLFWSFYIAWSVGDNLLGGSPSAEIRLTLPGGKTAGEQTQPIAFQAGSTGVPAVGNALFAYAKGSYITISKNDLSNFVVGDAPGMIATISFEVS